MSLGSRLEVPSTLKNSGKSHLAFKVSPCMRLQSWGYGKDHMYTTLPYFYEEFQTTAPKSCFMRPPGAVLAPGERIIIATVLKFVELPENNEKPMEQKCRAKFKFMSLKALALEKLRRQLADADAAVEALKRPPADAGPKIIGEGLVTDEWPTVALHGPRELDVDGSFVRR